MLCFILSLFCAKYWLCLWIAPSVLSYIFPSSYLFTPRCISLVYMTRRMLTSVYNPMQYCYISVNVKLNLFVDYCFIGVKGGVDGGGVNKHNWMPFTGSLAGVKSQYETVSTWTRELISSSSRMCGTKKIGTRTETKSSRNNGTNSITGMYTKYDFTFLLDVSSIIYIPLKVKVCFWSLCFTHWIGGSEPV